ncbi:nuclear transport factor 2 family protein [Novosphingobium sp. BL-52-GroH]|uniref:nuclear transport factor 2 family protein n=1 Tax=Novosphingobium sp. BL-52-GroH TaxID=3349877 RepID=UPI00384F7C27
MRDDLARLVDLEAIRMVKARYCRLLDTKEWDGFIALFTSDAVMDVQEDTGNPPITGHAAILEQVRFAVMDARSAHQVHSSEIDLGDDEAHVVTAMQDQVVWAPGKCPIPGGASITGFGHYHERYVRVEGEWKIAALKLTRLYVEVHPVPVA